MKKSINGNSLDVSQVLKYSKWFEWSNEIFVCMEANYVINHQYKLNGQVSQINQNCGFLKLVAESRKLLYIDSTQPSLH